eukprot:5995201-Amphidinium_carterae.1
MGVAVSPVCFTFAVLEHLSFTFAVLEPLLYLHFVDESSCRLDDLPSCQLDESSCHLDNVLSCQLDDSCCFCHFVDESSCPFDDLLASLSIGRSACVSLHTLPWSQMPLRRLAIVVNWSFCLHESCSSCCPCLAVSCHDLPECVSEQLSLGRCAGLSLGAVVNWTICPSASRSSCQLDD